MPSVIEKLERLFREHAETIVRMLPERCDCCGEKLPTLPRELLNYDPKQWAEKAFIAVMGEEREN